MHIFYFSFAGDGGREGGDRDRRICKNGEWGKGIDGRGER